MDNVALIRELNRAKAVFQLRSIATVIGVPPSIIDTGDETAWADLSRFPPFVDQATEYRPDPLRVDAAAASHATAITPEAPHDHE